MGTTAVFSKFPLQHRGQVVFFLHGEILPSAPSPGLCLAPQGLKSQPTVFLLPHGPQRTEPGELGGSWKAGAGINLGREERVMGAQSHLCPGAKGTQGHRGCVVPGTPTSAAIFALPLGYFCCPFDS